MNHQLQRTLGLGMLTLALSGLAAPTITGFAAVAPLSTVTQGTSAEDNTASTPLMNGERMPADYDNKPKIPAVGDVDSLTIDNNTRDLGDYITADGQYKIKTGVLFRSAQLTGLSDDQLKAYRKLNLQTDIDFRNDSTFLTQPDMPVTPNDVRRILIYSDASDDDSGVDHYNKGELSTLPEATKGYHDFLTTILDTPGATIYHCSHGNDRTGIATVLLMSIFGMKNNDIIKNYMMSNNYSRPYQNKKKNKIKPAKQVQYGWLKTYFDQIDKHSGNMENYIIKDLGFSKDQQEQLKAKYLVSVKDGKPYLANEQNHGTSNPDKTHTPKPTIPSKPSIIVPAPSHPTIVDSSNGDMINPDGSTNKPVKPSTSYAKPKHKKTSKIKVMSVRKIKRVRFVHLKGHRAYFFDMHLKHKVGRTGKTGLHPKAKWRLMKQAKIKIGGKTKTYVQVKSPHGHYRWIKKNDVKQIN